MHILILGGTRFLGYHLVAAAIAKGHEVSIFTRGVSHPTVHQEAEHLIGNRDGDLEALRGKKWDAVIDTSGYIPRVVRDSVSLLRDAVDHYTFISSISVYDHFLVPGKDETASLAQLSDPLTENIAESYGALKAACEQVVMEGMPEQSLIIRPGLIVGPRDNSDRFTYWPVRVKEGGQVLAPGKPTEPIQIIDVRDLAEWIVQLVELKHTGIYHATGPDYTLTMEQLLTSCKRATESNAEFIWVDDAYLVENEVGAWIELPLWIPATHENASLAYFQQVDVSKAIAAGLKFRPLHETIQATIDWHLTRDPSLEPRAGLNREKERRLIEQLRM